MSKRFSDLSHLVSAGRAEKGVPPSRQAILAALLRKRATASQVGLESLEAMLRSQILWSLPIERPKDKECKMRAPENERA
jgi:hypothetical protein